jgi:hypothetical protein
MDPDPQHCLLGSPGIDSQTGGPVQQPYLTYRPARLHMLTESIPWNRVLGSLLKRFQIRIKCSSSYSHWLISLKMIIGTEWISSDIALHYSVKFEIHWLG